MVMSMFLGICPRLLTLQTINHPVALIEFVSADLSSAHKHSALKNTETNSPTIPTTLSQQALTLFFQIN
jgi:hypothetical protein